MNKVMKPTCIFFALSVFFIVQGVNAQPRSRLSEWRSEFAIQLPPELNKISADCAENKKTTGSLTLCIELLTQAEESAIRIGPNERLEESIKSTAVALGADADSFEIIKFDPDKTKPEFVAFEGSYSLPEGKSSSFRIYFGQSSKLSIIGISNTPTAEVANKEHLKRLSSEISFLPDFLTSSNAEWRTFKSAKADYSFSFPEAPNLISESSPNGRRLTELLFTAKWGPLEQPATLTLGIIRGSLAAATPETTNQYIFEGVMSGFMKEYSAKQETHYDDSSRECVNHEMTFRVSGGGGRLRFFISQENYFVFYFIGTGESGIDDNVGRKFIDSAKLLTSCRVQESETIK